MCWWTCSANLHLSKAIRAHLCIRERKSKERGGGGGGERKKEEDGETTEEKVNQTIYTSKRTRAVCVSQISYALAVVTLLPFSFILLRVPYRLFSHPHPRAAVAANQCRSTWRSLALSLPLSSLSLAAVVTNDDDQTKRSRKLYSAGEWNFPSVYYRASRGRRLKVGLLTPNLPHEMYPRRSSPMIYSLKFVLVLSWSRPPRITASSPRFNRASS